MQLTVFIAAFALQTFHSGVLCQGDSTDLQTTSKKKPCFDLLKEAGESACQSRGLGGFGEWAPNECSVQCKESDVRIPLPRDIPCQRGSFSCGSNRDALMGWKKENEDAITRIQESLCPKKEK